MTCHARLRIVVLVALALLSRQVTATQDPESRIWLEDRLVDLRARQAILTMSVPTPSVAAMRLAGLMLDDALRLRPDDLDLLRRRLDLADIAEEYDRQRELVLTIARMDPEDEVMRLRAIRLAMEAYQTIEELIEAHERMLAGDPLARVGRPIASRLAFDLAILHQRAGDTEAFVAWLTRSTSWDQTNKSAAAMAAGYFRGRVNDPVAETELLANLAMADPADHTTFIVLGQHLLEHGAYAGAARTYGIAVDLQNARGVSVSPDLLADLALAQWAAGRTSAALETIRDRQITLNIQLRNRLYGTRLSARDRIFSAAALPATMALVRSAIYEHTGSELLGRAMESVQRGLSALADPQDQTIIVSDEERFELYLYQAWLLMWLGGPELLNGDFIRDRIAAAERIRELPEPIRARHEGWLALRAGDLESAIDRLGAAADVDLASRLGLAIAEIESGDTRSGARRLADLAYEHPGTLLGIWSEKRLERLLGQPVPPSDIARGMERILRDMPALIDRVGTSPNRLVSMQIDTLHTTRQVFDPIPIRIVLRNSGSIPIGIGPDGPVRPRVAIEPQMTLARLASLGVRPGIVNIARKLRLDPGESIEKQFDLYRELAAEPLISGLTSGVNIDLRGTHNFRLNASGLIEPGAMGMTNRIRPLRVEGVRVNIDWLEETLALIEDPGSVESIKRMALLSDVLSRNFELIDPDLGAALPAAGVALEESFANAPPLVQAWLLSIISSNVAALEPLIQFARGVDNDDVIISYILTQATDAQDPMIDVAIRSESPRVQAFGRAMRAFAEEQAVDPATSQP